MALIVSEDDSPLTLGKGTRPFKRTSLEKPSIAIRVVALKLCSTCSQFESNRRRSRKEHISKRAAIFGWGRGGIPRRRNATNVPATNNSLINTSRPLVAAYHLFMPSDRGNLLDWSRWRGPDGRFAARRPPKGYRSIKPRTGSNACALVCMCL